ncbi:hypothetical protein [Absidia glauca]|uniref:Uncharacterized protein n=1 Tax=Absidia glauca TaxID=4829 RepID=A0A168SUD7_ABSGL|nr:hypothetical protein [Absidia glauca]
MTFSSDSSDVEYTAIILAESHSTVIGDVARTTITEQQGKIQQQQGQQCEGNHHCGKNLSVYKQWNIKKWKFHELIIDYVTVLYVLLSDGYDKQERDLSVDTEEELDEQDNHHGQRTDEFYLNNIPTDQPLVASAENAWMAGDLNISQMCYDFKAAPIGLHCDAANMDDVRLLALNDVYVISKVNDISITKYFAKSEGEVIQLFGALMLPKTPPSDYFSTVAIVNKCTAAALITRNQVDVLVASALAGYLHLFYAGPPPFLDENSFVHHYLAPIMKLVFDEKCQLNVDWNMRLGNSSYKLDLLVSSTCGDVLLDLIIGEFKPPNHNSSQVEPDLVKLGKQMRIMINKLVTKGVPNPVVGGVLVQ